MPCSVSHAWVGLRELVAFAFNTTCSSLFKPFYHILFLLFLLLLLLVALGVHLSVHCVSFE